MFLLMGGRNPEGSELCSPINYIHCVLGDPNNLLNDNQLLEMAQECHQWRKLVGDCSTTERRMMRMMNPIMFKYY